jgi:hypothetical protein
MSAEEFNLKAERLWAAVPSGGQEKILSTVWCVRCRGAVRIVDYSVSEQRGDVILRGRCATCGAPVTRLVETSELRDRDNS